MRGICGGWSCYVEQERYGHRAKKATWLYAFGVVPPTLRWGHIPDSEVRATVSWCGNEVRGTPGMPRISKAAASRTPEEFRDVLVEIARTSRREARRDR